MILLATVELLSICYPLLKMKIVVFILILSGYAENVSHWVMDLG